MSDNNQNPQQPGPYPGHQQPGQYSGSPQPGQYGQPQQGGQFQAPPQPGPYQGGPQQGQYPTAPPNWNQSGPGQQQGGYPGQPPHQYGGPAYSGQQPYQQHGSQPTGYQQQYGHPSQVATKPIPAFVWLGGSVLAFLGSFLPWAEASTGFGKISVNGTEGDGKLTLFFALVSAVLAGLWILKTVGRHIALPIGGIVAGAIIALIGMYDWSDISGIVSVGIGLIFVTLGGLIAIGGATWALLTRDKF